MRKLLSVLCLILLIPVCLITATEQELALTGPETLYAKENFSLELMTGVNDLTQITFTLAYDGEDLLFYERGGINGGNLKMAQPGGQVMSRPERTWKCRWWTLWPACSPMLDTTR